MEKWPIGVFASVDAGLGVHLDVVQELGIPTIQVHAPHKQTRTPEAAQEFLDRCNAAGIQITCVFGGFDGESYADIPTTKKTVGLVPLETRAARVEEMKEISDFARLLGCHTVALHIGFVPEDRNSEDYKALVTETQHLLDYVKVNSQVLNLETGQESADHLLDFISDVARDNLKINFDPANMILYGTGDPIAALQRVGHLVASVHCKDATWAPEGKRGIDWGAEVPLGEGDVGMATYLRALNDIEYTGPLTIEREIPEDREQQKADIGKAVDLLDELKELIG
ncbi:MAG: sugar phosphate isomerase/epimerase [Planctomycetes bacterium]|nr:sugar phosphate isomerase/epimerase [Planctomycetota bacterium]MCH9727735.1 sugar phosphate isomerase/epimerase [Planctomycetota bacterium]MCH9776940.1 sugar phosphate isomerase/epimerase [Planctomycetota bacterium]MCH9792830.1 sugar phosphate isomerase/epimerase [Planctomycetota bacterium]MDF1743505.1 sugar phosphate isomerase/epimerase [Gimesia sp.]